MLADKLMKEKSIFDLLKVSVRENHRSEIGIEK